MFFFFPAPIHGLKHGYLTSGFKSEMPVTNIPPKNVPKSCEEPKNFHVLPLLGKRTRPEKFPKSKTSSRTQAGRVTWQVWEHLLLPEAPLAGAADSGGSHPSDSPQNLACVRKAPFPLENLGYLCYRSFPTHGRRGNLGVPNGAGKGGKS